MNSLLVGTFRTRLRRCAGSICWRQDRTQTGARFYGQVRIKSLFSKCCCNRSTQTRFLPGFQFRWRKGTTLRTPPTQASPSLTTNRLTAKRAFQGGIINNARVLAVGEPAAGMTTSKTGESMKRMTLGRILALVAIVVVTAATSQLAEAGRRCTDSATCTACKNCSGCQYRAKDGGTCGVCKPPATKLDSWCRH